MRFVAWLVAGFGFVLAACGEAPEPVPQRPSPTPEITAAVTAGSRTATDMTGRTVSIPETVTTVAALSPAAAEFALALGLQVVGRSSDTAETLAAGAKPTGSTISPDFAAVAALQPDLVIADAAYHSGRTRDFDRFAYPVFVLKANTYPEVLDALRELANATGRVETGATAAAAITTRADAAIAAAKRNAASATAPPKVLILTGGGRDVFAGGSGSYLGDLVSRLGGANVLAGAADGGPIAGFGVIEIGQAAQQLPDVVLILSSGQGGLAAQLMADPRWANTPAVKSGRIHDLDTMLYLRAPGPRVSEALEGLLPLLWR